MGYMARTASLAVVLTAFLAAAALLASAVEGKQYILLHDGSRTAEDIVSSALGLGQDDAGESGRRRAAEVIISKGDLDISTRPSEPPTRGGDSSGGDRAGTLLPPPPTQLISLLEISDDDVAPLKSSSGVLAVAENSVISISTESITVPPEDSTSLWNLDRIDQDFGMDGRFIQSNESGVGVDLYILDTGVQANHSQFGEGRVESGRNTYSDFGIGVGADEDCNGHGTHVASTAAGKTFGIARNAQIVPVKIMECDGTGSVYNLINGLTWARDESTRRNYFFLRRGVVNLSISANGNTLIDQAVRSAVSAGLLVVVAAGNSQGDACLYSPSREPMAFTVGATSQDDSMAPFSNTGSCVDIFAPGDNVLGAAPTGYNATAVKRGTSMATPHVTGVAATVLERFPNYSPADVTAEILKRARPLNNTMDDDCGGLVTSSALFLQSLGAWNSPVSPEVASHRRKSIYLPGDKLDGEFLYWFPELAYADADVCVTFGVKVINVRQTESQSSVAPPVVEPSDARVLVTVASDKVELGFSEYMSLPDSCKVPKVTWRVFDLSADAITIKDEAGFYLSQTLLPSPSPLIFSTSLVMPLYVSASRIDPNKWGLEVGTGDGVSKDSSQLVFVDDMNMADINTRAFVSFSTTTNFDLQITDVRPCGADVSSGSAAGGGEDGDEDSVEPLPPRVPRTRIPTPSPIGGKKANKKKKKKPAKKKKKSKKKRSG